jgi:hypothetical protein
MNKDQDREQKALDALIAAALRQDPCAEDDFRKLKAAAQSLTPEDRQALDTFDAALVARILAGTWRPRSAAGEKTAVPEHPAEEELAGSMHRGDEGGELTDAAREEMEQKLRELKDEDEAQP